MLIVEGQFENGFPNGYCRILELYEARHYRGFVKKFLRNGPGQMFETIYEQFESIFENDKDVAESTKYE